MFPLLLAASTTYFTTLRLRTYLHPFQQEEYDNTRLAQWWIEKRAFDRYASLGLAIGVPFGFWQPLAPVLNAIVWLVLKSRQEPDPTRTAKKALVMTPRATHTWYLASLLVVPAIVALAVAPVAPWLQMLGLIVLIQMLPLALMIANILLKPLQSYQNRKYLTEAHTLLARLAPTTVGITGSFGKTSTKYILNHILGSSAPTLSTPGSVNTPLGIARIVREQLQPQHQYFLAEMGAYGPGSIAGLCKLAPPSIACITAVGQAHYERFKSLETVAQAKFEIPDALWQPRVAQAPESYVLVTSRPEILRGPHDYYIEKAEATSTGQTLTLAHGGTSTPFHAPIHGAVQSGNLAVAFAVASELGLPAKTIAASMATAQPAPYRLNVQHNGRQTILDDSYNANPQGFAAALETLSLQAHADPAHPRRRVLITPGMVELGKAHDAEHARLGALAATHADVILAIGPARIPTFIQAVKQNASQAELHTFPSLQVARTWVQAHGQPDDVILIANDLPDRYESRWEL
ncbi:MAG: UDP-N-acetylmuramoyl-tripeptide--D-alanyl-D-alanine ligase [Pseudomonas fluorescens]|nr:MAG: UDP-N-acetylmuramoyl-tripeptide--D-alanyl-D-alanine ligase [Pseudomonas fluorescens]